MPAVASELVEALDRIAEKRPRVLVWGDSCYDRYVHGTWRDSSREVFDTTDDLHGVTSDGEDSDELYANGMAKAVWAACNHIACDGGRLGIGFNTVFWGTKTRFIAAGKVVFRVDKPCGDYHGVDAVAGNVAKRVSDYSALLIADYGRGCCTVDGLRTVIDAANAAGIVTIVDPHRQSDWSRYEGATVIKASREHWRQQRCASPIVLTSGANGMSIMRPEGWQTAIPTQPRAVLGDTVACGDLVTAVIGCCLAVGIDLDVACRLANVAAGLKTQHWGPRAPTREEIRAAIG